ncbi:NAD(P)-binding protein [Decorospora gaudefroyi]|uniref:NAD(P)-binding protein n=1 Tax=Decorospora gaudefroyi TaxID=184978 RepID=A0A6A5JX13_9PLEO|nr:NAD(P)-binding protein [Decorospora gaudefroyi]
MPSVDPIAQVPRHQTAIVATGPGQLSIQHDAPVPALAPDMILVRAASVALNPVDIKSLDYSAALGAIMGFDFAGTVAALGDEAAKDGRLSVGDRVAGVVYGMDKLQPDVGAFAQYIGALADLVLKIPETLSFEDAAALGLATATAAYGLFKELALPGSLDRLVSSDEAQDGDFVLVAGGATATGTRAIELLKTAGFRPVATSSPSNFELVKKFGAEKVFDYHDEDCAEQIRAYTGNELEFALDCVAEAETTQMCYGAIGRAGGRYVAVEPFRDSIAQGRSHTVEPSWFNVMTIWGRKVELGGEYAREASAEDRAFGARSFAAVQTLVDRGLVTTHPVKVMPGSFEGIAKGLAQLRSQPPSGYKLVYRIAEL